MIRKQSCWDFYFRIFSKISSGNLSNVVDLARENKEGEAFHVMYAIVSFQLYLKIYQAISSYLHAFSSTVLKGCFLFSQVTTVFEALALDFLGGLLLLAARCKLKYILTLTLCPLMMGMMCFVG